MNNFYELALQDFPNKKVFVSAPDEWVVRSLGAGVLVSVYHSTQLQVTCKKVLSGTSNGVYDPFL